ncbi:FAD-dependent oxidoreductase [Microbacterium sp. ET2]|uniref:FAD-dependent oxidoreductase n=1 Tax=Microbacterium albipurpureum TaxID=3050384 RepID=UPI00259CEB20|nr:FAD-dependent oxidoreductase [Microbacterium sp. ET2 (Ac-2212)]WJL96339.1 FAD-dependent oxidoreductase [Microbacterium sp. ET2 (Ac-2212)]
MTVDEHVHDVLIIGGGPAGMAAAATAATRGLDAVLIDERPTLGGQVYKQPGPGMRVVNGREMGKQYRQGRSLIDEAEASGSTLRLRSSVVDLEPSDDGWTAMVHPEDGVVVPLRARAVILATGAHDRPVVFPGWDLPGVITAGGLQTLAKTQSFVPGDRVVFAGSGPVALAFPAQLAGYGANIVTALEAGPAPSITDLARIAAAAPGNVGLLGDAARYQATLLRRGIPLKYRRIVVRAEGEGRVERVVHARVDERWRVLPGTEEVIDADILCIGYGFTPSAELLRLVGCRFDVDEDLGGPVVHRDDLGRTDVAGIYVAGDGAGVEGSAVAADEGRLAAFAVMQDLGAPIEGAAAVEELRRRIGRRRSLTKATTRMYHVGDGIFGLADDDTVVCRCERVREADIRAAVTEAADVSAVKALTRAGMGPCQGRMCGRHIAALIAEQKGVAPSTVLPATPRMPARPVPIGAIADADVADPGLFQAGEDDPVEPERTDLAPDDLAGQPRDPLTDTDVLVIGGGIAGAAVAYYLAREGVEVELLDRGQLNREASGTNAGSFHFQLAIHQLSGKGTDADRSRLLSDARASVEAYALWTSLSDELGADVGLHQTGGWMVAETPEQLSLLHEKHLLEEEAGIHTEVLEGAALRARAPYFSDRVLGATYCDLEGHANPLIVAPLYARRAREHGARLRVDTEVFAIEADESDSSYRFRVTTSAGVIRARHIVNCAGGWAGEIGAMVGLDFPIRREGLHVNVTEARRPLLPSMIQHIGRRLTLKQTHHGSFIIGGGWPSPATGYPRRYPTTWRSAAGNLRVALDVVPQLEDVRVVRTWSGVIAFTDDYSPIVGESERVPGYHACVASTGFTFSPIYARQVAESIVGPARTASRFPTRFSLDRTIASAPTR